MNDTKNVLEENVYKRVTLTMIDGKRKIGIIEQVSNSYVLFMCNGIIEQLNIEEIQSVTPQPDKY